VFVYAEKNKLNYVGFEVLTEVTMNSMIGCNAV
jgi:hypothetical protein